MYLVLIQVSLHQLQMHNINNELIFVGTSETYKLVNYISCNSLLDTVQEFIYNE